MTTSLMFVLTQFSVIAAKMVTVNGDDGSFFMTTGGGQSEWFGDAILIVPICVALVLCCWMYFRFQKKKITVNQMAFDETVKKHLSSIDERISNLETLVVEREKEQKFREL